MAVQSNYNNFLPDNATAWDGTTIFTQSPKVYPPEQLARDAKLAQLLRVAKEFYQLDIMERQVVNRIVSTLDALLMQGTAPEPSTQKLTHSGTCASATCPCQSY